MSPSVALLVGTCFAWLAWAAPAHCWDLAAAGVSPSASVPERLRVREQLLPYIYERRFADGEAAARVLLDEATSAHGARSIQAARVRDVIVEFLWRAGKIGTDTMAFAEETLAIKQECLGPAHPELGTTLHLMAHMTRRSAPVKSRGYYERALQLFEAGGYDFELDVALVLNSLSTPVFVHFAEYQKGREYIERSVAIRERRLPPDHPDVAMSLQNHGLFLDQLGEYRIALESLSRAVEIFTKAHGPEHPSVAGAGMQLGLVKAHIGDHIGARDSYAAALAIFEREYGPASMEVATVLNNLGLLLIEWGDLRQARSVLERALVIREEKDKGGMLLAANLRRLAKVDRLEGNYEPARLRLDRAAGIEGQRRPDHADNAYLLDEFALLEEAAGNLPAALEYRQRSLALREAALGPDVPLVALSAAGLGDLWLRLGEPQRADSLFQRALAINERAFGPEFIGLGGPLRGLSLARAATGDPAAAFALALRAEGVTRVHVERTLRWLGARQALELLRSRTSALGILLSLLDPSPENADWTEAAWDAVIRSRAVHLDEMAKRHRAIVATQDVETKELARALRETRETLAQLAVRVLNADAGDPMLTTLHSAAAAKDSLEDLLAARSAAFRHEREQQQARFGDVKAALPEGSALVAFVRYAREPVGAVPEPRFEYAALVLPGPDREAIHVPLGDAARIDSLVVEWRREAGTQPRGSRSRQAQAERKYLAVAGELRRQVWDLVAPHVTDAATVFIVPDGGLHLLNFATLPVAGDQYLLETGPLIHYLSCERDLIRPVVDNTAPANVLLLGNPDFDLTSDVGGPPDDVPESNVGSSDVYRSALQPCDALRSLPFEPLPAAQHEVAEIANLWNTPKRSSQGKTQVLELTGAQASEAAFKQHAPGSHIVHVATHAFFTPNLCSGEQHFGSAPAAGTARSEGYDVVLEENPLLLAGLALAGANARGAAELEDGILVADEIASLDLTGTRLAVLSACETAVGQIEAGEGVFSLRRAFEIAGAGTVVTSLWPIKDESGRDWMILLYGELSSGAGLTVGVQRANANMLERRHRGGQTTHPYSWGAFVVAGDWR